MHTLHIHTPTPFKGIIGASINHRFKWMFQGYNRAQLANQSNAALQVEYHTMVFMALGLVMLWRSTELVNTNSGSSKNGGGGTAVNYPSTSGHHNSIILALRLPSCSTLVTNQDTYTTYPWTTSALGAPHRSPMVRTFPSVFAPHKHSRWEQPGNDARVKVFPTIMSNTDLPFARF